MKMRRTLSSCALALALPLTLAVPVPAQTNDELRRELEALKQGQQQIRNELAELKKLLQQKAAPAPSGPDVAGKVFDLGANPVKGEPSAKLTLVEFTDYQ